MYFGTQYYRPPFPSSTEWDRDLQLISNTGFNVVKIWAVWSWIERKPGEYFFADLDQLVYKCGLNQLQVVINIIPEGVPYWLERQHSDACYCNQKGEKLAFSGAANIPSGGWPGLCRDKPEVEALANRFLTTIAGRYSNHDNVMGYDVWNEPHIDPAFDYPDDLFCYCNYSRVKFTEWLKNKYGTIHKVNQVWHRAYMDWIDVMTPIRFGTYPDMMDWRQFWLENHALWLASRVRAVKDVAPEKIAMTHVPFSGYLGQCGEGGLGQTLTDEFLLADQVEHFGLTSFPKWLMNNDFLQHFMNVELVAAASEGKPFWQSELQSGGGLWGIEGNPVALPEEIRLWNWNAIAGGAKGVLYWQWRPEPSGLESPGFGLTSLDGGYSERTIAAGIVARKLLSEVEFHRAKSMLPTNGIFVSRTSDLFAFAANRGEKLYAQGLYGVYQAAFQAGIPVRFVHGDHLEQAMHEGLKVLYVSSSLALNEEELSGLTRFAELGGTLVLEACTGMYDESGTIRAASLIHQLLGLESLTLSIFDQVEFEWEDGNGKLKSALGARYRQEMMGRAEGIQVTGHFTDGSPAAGRIQTGKGEVHWVGTFPSVAVTRFNSKDAAAFVAASFGITAYEHFELISMEGNAPLVYRLFESEHNMYIIACNYHSYPSSLAWRWKGIRELHLAVDAMDGVLFSWVK